MKGMVLPPIFKKSEEIEQTEPEPQPSPLNAYNKSVAMESDDLHKWEMEVEGLLDNLYNSLLGKSKVNGVWLDDPFKMRVMNEYGASSFRNELESRISINMQMSNLREQTILDIVSGAGKAYAALITVYHEKWEIDTKNIYEVLDSVCTKLTDTLIILLNISRDGGMREVSAMRGTKTVENTQQGGLI